MVKKIMLAGALLLTILHNVVPHAHHGELAAQEHERLHRQADGLLDFLGLAFQQDIDFSPVQATHVQDIGIFLTPTHAPGPEGSPRYQHFPTATAHRCANVPFTPAARQATTAHGLRAPPTAV